MHQPVHLYLRLSQAEQILGLPGGGFCMSITLTQNKGIHAY